MNKIVKVVLNRAEGPTSDCGKTEFGEQAIRNGQVLKVLQVWGRTAPILGCYDKVDFEVQWEGGESYAGRFDMQHGGTDGWGTFWVSLRRRLEYYACRVRPSHFNDNHWDHFVKTSEENGNKALCESILDGCEVPAV